MSILRRASSSFVRTATRSATRSFSTGTPVRVEAGSAPNLGSVKSPKQPIGGFRGGIIGFLLGFSLASSYAAFQLLEEYKLASSALQASVQELQESTAKVTQHVKRIDAVEKDLKALSSATVSKDDLSRLRAELKKIYDGLEIEFLNLRSHVWGMQQDLQALQKKEETTVRI